MKTPAITPSDLIVIDGPEQATIVDPPLLADAGLPPVAGAQAWQVFRASKGAPELADGLGYTYNHHVDMAVWKGLYYVAWNSCERDEDVWPSRELYSTSADGATWEPPRELFPQGVSTCLRMYFYLAPNGRMLVIAGLRVSREEVSEETKGNLIVRQLMPDHALGRVHALQLLDGSGDVAAAAQSIELPMFDTSPDTAFVEACRHLLSDTVYLEQQDLGTLLQDRRMKWHDPANWPGGVVPGDSSKWRSGKAFSFFKRPDGLRVGVSKMGFTTCSTDDGQTWSQPVVPPTLVTGKAKVWSQRTADGRYALAYNPTRRSRFPLVVVTSDDGQHFSGMRVVQGELPRQRYTGLHRSVGPQYTRGLSEWSDDGTIPDAALWLVYSMSKEDIWVSRVPLPIATEAVTSNAALVIADEHHAAHIADDFSTFPTGPRVAGWNTYSPRWSDVRVGAGVLTIANRDPYDFATATRLFPAASIVKIELTLTAAQCDRGRLEIDVVSPAGSVCPVRVALDNRGQITAVNNGEPTVLATYIAGRTLVLSLQINTDRGAFSLAVDGQSERTDIPFAFPAASVHRLTLRTGEARNFGGNTPVDPLSDCPQPGMAFAIGHVGIST